MNIFKLIFLILLTLTINLNSETINESERVKSALTGFSSLVDSFDIFHPKEKYNIIENDDSRLFLSSDFDSIQGDHSLRLDYILKPYTIAGSYVAAEWQIYPSFDFSGATRGSIWIKGDGSHNIFAIGFMDADDEIWLVKSTEILLSVGWSEFSFTLKDFQLSSLGNINGNKKFDTSSIKSILYIIESKGINSKQGSIKLDNFTFQGANFPAEVIEREPYSLIQSGYVDVEYRKIRNYFNYYPAEFKKGDLLWNLLFLNIVYKTDKILGVGVLRLGGLDFGFSNERYGIANSFQSDFTILLYLNRILKFINFIKIGRLGPYFNDYTISEEYEIGSGSDNRSRTGHFLMGLQTQGKIFSLLNYDIFYIKHWHNSFTTGIKSSFKYDILNLTGSIVDYEGKALYKKDINNFQSKLAIQDLSYTLQGDLLLSDLVESGLIQITGIYGENKYKRYAKIYQPPFNEYEDITAANEITNDLYFREAYDFSDISFMRDRDLNYLFESLDKVVSQKGSFYKTEIILDEVLYTGVYLKGIYEKFTPYFLPIFRNREILRERPNILFFNQREMYGINLGLQIWKFYLSGFYNLLKSTLNENLEYYYKNGINYNIALKYRIYGQSFLGLGFDNLKLVFPNNSYDKYTETRYNAFLKFAMIRKLNIIAGYTFLKIINSNSNTSKEENISYYSSTIKWDFTNDAFLQFDYSFLNPVDAPSFNYGPRGPNMYEPKDLIKILLHIDFRL